MLVSNGSYFFLWCFCVTWFSDICLALLGRIFPLVILGSPLSAIFSVLRFLLHLFTCVCEWGIDSHLEIELRSSGLAANAFTHCHLDSPLLFRKGLSVVQVNLKFL